MGAIKTALLDAQIERDNFMPTAADVLRRDNPLPLKTMYVLTFFGEPLSLYAHEDQARYDLAVCRTGAYLASRDQQEIDAYAIKPMDVCYENPYDRLIAD